MNEPDTTQAFNGKVPVLRPLASTRDRCWRVDKGGGNGIIGTEFAKRAPPDGYTLLAASTSTHVMTPHAVANLPFDPLQDFVPVINLAYQTKVVLVSSALGVIDVG